MMEYVIDMFLSFGGSGDQASREHAIVTLWGTAPHSRYRRQIGAAFDWVDVVAVGLWLFGGYEERQWLES